MEMKMMMMMMMMMMGGAGEEAVWAAHSLAWPGFTCRFWSFKARPMFPLIFNFFCMNAWREERKEGRKEARKQG